MAQTVAFGFFAESLEDREKAFAKYLRFVDGAGTKTFDELVRGADMTPPYEAGCLEKTARVIEKWLAEQIEKL